MLAKIRTRRSLKKGKPNLEVFQEEAQETDSTIYHTTDNKRLANVTFMLRNRAAWDEGVKAFRVAGHPMVSWSIDPVKRSATFQTRGGQVIQHTLRPSTPELPQVVAAGETCKFWGWFDISALAFTDDQTVTLDLEVLTDRGHELRFEIIGHHYESPF